MSATPTQVRDITGSVLVDNAILPFLDAAACVMLRLTDCTNSMSTACIDQAEAYLAAHLLTSSNVGKSSAQVSKESINGKYSVEYLAKSASGSGVLSTPFGETANVMLGGCLAQLDKTPTGLLSIGSL